MANWLEVLDKEGIDVFHVSEIKEAGANAFGI